MKIVLKKVENLNSDNNIYTVNKLLDLMDYEDINNQAYEISIKWSNGIEDLFIINGDFIAPVAQLDVYNFFKEYLTAIKIYEKLINLNKNIILDNSNKLLIQNLMKINKVTGNKLFFETKRYIIEKKHLKNKLLEITKRNFKENYIKYLLGLFVKKKKKNQEDIIVFADVYNRPTNEMLNLVSSNIEKPNIIITSEPRISKHFFMNKGIPLGSFINLKLLIKFIRERFIYSKRLKKIKNKISFDFGNKAINRLISSEFEKKIKKLFLTCVLDNYILHNLINEVNPKLIILGTDCHRLSRHLVIISKKYNIKSLVIQHGATNGKYGFAPLFANKIAVWGNISKKILIDWGIPEENIIITGNPRFGKIKSYRQKDCCKSKYAEKLKILVALSPYEKDVTVEILTLVFEAVKNIKDITLIVKPHPSEKNIYYYEEIIKRHNYIDVILDEKSSTNYLLADSDVVVSAQSTIGIEALLFGKTLIEIDSKRISKKIPYDKYNCCYQVKNVNDFINAIASIREKDSSFNTIMNNSNKFLYDYLGDPNTNTYKKIKEFINILLGE
jgi:Capsule polysaccharide biosynthesis protein